MSENVAVEKNSEAAMVDLTYALLLEKGEPMMYHEIMNHVSKSKGFSEEEIEKFISQLYTDINIDGRFTCVGRGLWGLKYWYPIEQTTESAVAANVKDDYLEDEVEEEIFEEETAGELEDSVEIDDLDDDLSGDEDKETLIEEAVEIDLEKSIDDEEEDEEDEDDEDEDDLHSS